MQGTGQGGTFKEYIKSTEGEGGRPAESEGNCSSFFQRSCSRSWSQKRKSFPRHPVLLPPPLPAWVWTLVPMFLHGNDHFSKCIRLRALWGIWHALLFPVPWAEPPFQVSNNFLPLHPAIWYCPLFFLVADHHGGKLEQILCSVFSVTWRILLLHTLVGWYNSSIYSATGKP